MSFLDCFGGENPDSGSARRRAANSEGVDMVLTVVFVCWRLVQFV